MPKDTQYTDSARSEHAHPRLDIGTLARNHYDAVFRFCARRIGFERAEDASQETFLTAQKALRKFRGESTVTTWLLGIAHNECRRVARRERLEPLQLEFDPHYSKDGEEILVDRQVLTEALAELSPEHREVVWLHELDGLTYEEVAQLLGIPVGTVKSRLHHAFLNLRRAIVVPEGKLP